MHPRSHLTAAPGPHSAGQHSTHTGEPHHCRQRHDGGKPSSRGQAGKGQAPAQQHSPGRPIDHQAHRAEPASGSACGTVPRVQRDDERALLDCGVKGRLRGRGAPAGFPPASCLWTHTHCHGCCPVADFCLPAAACSHRAPLTATAAATAVSGWYGAYWAGPKANWSSSACGLQRLRSMQRLLKLLGPVTRGGAQQQACALGGPSKCLRGPKGG
jgi:hypothetical protein